LATPIADNQTVQVVNTDGTLWSSNMQFVANANPLRFNPAIHVNQEGYLPNYAKQAMIGYYAGSMGEVPISTNAGFELADATTGAQVFQGALTARPDVGYEYTPTPYQQVYQADFSTFSTPGQYRLVVPGMGASMPFRIDEGIGMCFARAYALGLYHQRCGTNLGLPYTRFAHAACHAAPASVPMPASSFAFTWTTIANYGVTINANNPPQVAPFLTSPQADLFPDVNQGTLDVSGGHHDAGDYSKYTINSASLVHYLMFEVDSLPGVAALDNLGIAESGDGISDVMEEAKWESDFLAKMQDADGGFYFLVYPVDREYESNVTPEDGDPQVVWPKTTSVTAASVAALAQCASSPLFKRTYPATAALYLQKAQLGWKFLTNAIAKYGYRYNAPYQVMQDGAYQKITAYGDDFADNDELAWAACEMFLATGDANAHQMLLSWFNPSNPATWRWGWWHMSESYGNCIRSYAFAVQSGRVASASQLNATFLAECTNEIATAGNDVLAWSQQNAYGTSFPTATKDVQSAGWYFSADQAFDMIVAYQLNPNTNYLTGLLANMNYEGGCNPVNVCYVTGLGWKRQHGIVSQWELNDIRAFPPSGIPIGNIQSDFDYLWDYAGELEGLSFPSDGADTAPYPFYDRWGDSWNVTTEMVVLNQARGLGALAFLAAQTSLGSQPWQAVPAQITVPSGVTPVGSNVTVAMQVPGLDLTTARITWEANGQQPAFGQTFTFAPADNGPQWVEAEAQFSDGRRVFASNNFIANSPNIIWVEDSIPTGGVPGSSGGDAWNWVSGNPTPYSGLLAQQSAIASGEHQVYFDDATATLTVESNAVLYAWIYLDPSNLPSEAMLQWNDQSGSWEHRAYWGANLVTSGVDGTASRTNMGALPAAGQWVQLTVPAAVVNLAGSTVNGLAFTLYGGRATWDCAGVLNSMAVATNSTITVNPTSPVASLIGLTPGTFTLSRAGNASAALSVSYTLGGSATPGVNYQVSEAGQPQMQVVGQPPPMINFPAGSNSVALTVTPLASTNVTAAQNIVITVGAGAGYSVGAPGRASIFLAGNNIPVASTQMSGGSPVFTWASAANSVYCVFYKNNLTDPTWLPAGPNITATGATTTWTDTNNANTTQRFYVLMQVQ
jgi:Glycosyl hydrolase family 9/Cellulase N-terminal ig-like domain